MSNVLTKEEKNFLSCYILLTTNWRHEEAETWERLAKDGNEIAKENAKYFRDMDNRLKVIKDKLDSFEETEQSNNTTSPKIIKYEVTKYHVYGFLEGMTTKEVTTMRFTEGKSYGDYICMSCKEIQEA